MPDNDHCKNCGGPVLVQIQKNTGFCCAKCEEDFPLKEKPKKAKKKAKRKASEKKAVRTVVE